MTDLPCGCAHCGCICAEHSAARIPQPCQAHAGPVIAAFIAHEAATLVSLTLFIGAVAIWCGLLIWKG